MRQDFKRVVSAALATVMVAQAGGVSALAAPLTTQSTTTTSATPTAAGMHQFTGTPALIQSAIEDLKAQGVTAEEKKEDKALVQRVETASDKNYDTVKSDLAQALIAQREDGTVDVSDLDLTQKDMAAVLQETLYDKYMNHAVTDVTYKTEGGKVTGINYNMSEGFAAAMDAIDDEQQDVAVDTDAVASEAAEQAAAEQGPAVYSAIATYAADDEETPAAGGDAESGAGDGSGETESKCKSHTVGVKTTIREDVNGDGEVDVNDLAAVRKAILDTADEDVEPDANGDGSVDVDDLAAIRMVALGDAEPTKTTIGSDIKFEWTEVADTTPVMDANNNVLNGGLIYDVKNHQITQGILPDYSYKLTKVSFTCSKCGEEIEITDEDTLNQMMSRKDVYFNTKTTNKLTPDHGKAPEIPEGESKDDYIQYTDMEIATYMDDTFTGAQDEDGNYIGLYTANKDNGELQVKNYYAQLSAFNADNAEYLGVSTDFWTSKNSESNPMAAVKALCNLDVDQKIPPSQMLQMVQMLPQAFMAYVYYYGAELLAMRDKAMAVVNALPAGTTEVQKQLVLHDWLADNCTFDMGTMTNVTNDGGNPDTDPIQMTTFGSLLSDQLSEMPTYTDDQGKKKSYYGAICLGYSAAYTYLIQNMHPEVYKKDGKWKTPDEVAKDDLVDFIQAKFYADTANTSVAGEGFGGGAFNNVHYMNAVRLKNAPSASSDGEWFYTDVCYDDIYIECMSQYRGEAQGSIYHTYFLMSPQSIASLYETGKSIDYIDSLYDGYTYEIAYEKNEDGSYKTDDNGNKIIVPSENIDSKKTYYDATHPKYEKVETTAEKKNDNTCYEDSWFSGAVSRIYNDAANWYYVDGGKTMASQRQSAKNSDNDDMKKKIDLEAYIHSNRVNVKNGDKLRTRAMSSPDYWEDNSSSSGNLGGMGSFGVSNKEDTYATTLFDYGTGKFSNTNAPSLEAEAKQSFAYTEQYPGLTHSIGLYDGKIYFNLVNRIYTYDTKAAADANPVALFKEYNEVKYSNDGRAFTATGFYADENGPKSVTNKPIASLEIFDDYDFSAQGGAYTPVTDGDGNITGMKFNGNVPAYPTLVVNIGTDFSFSYPNVKDASTRYTVEAVNLNPDYQRRVSPEGTNTNEEFLWCANIRDTAKMTDLLADLTSEEASEVTVPADCYTAEHVQTRTAKYGLVKVDNAPAEGAKPLGHDYEYNTAEKMYICKTCGQHASVLLNAGENGTAVMTSVADTGMGSLLDEMGGMGGSMGLSKTADSVDPEREAATKAKDGEITLTVTPNDGYEVDKVYYVEEGSEVHNDLTANEDGIYTITKPAACIQVHVTFTEKEAESYKITVDSSIQHGKVEVKDNATEAKADDKVILTVTPDPGYELAENGLKVSYEAPVEAETQADDTEEPAEPKTETKYVNDVVKGEADNTYIFTMPAYDVKVEAEFVEVKAETYDITVDTTVEGGMVTADKKTAAKDETVTLTVVADETHELDTLVVTYEVPGEGEDAKPTPEEVEVKAVADKEGEYTFTMPAGAVTVTPTFKAKEETKPATYSIEIPQTLEYGNVVASQTEAAAGTEITLTVNPDKGYQLKENSLRIETFNAATGKTESETLTVTDGKATFTMPAANVTVQAAFEQINSGENGSDNGSDNGDSGNAGETDPAEPQA